MESASFYNFRGRLAQFRRIPEHREYWEERWSKITTREQLRALGETRLEELEEILSRHLSGLSPLLEAGCGTGELLLALSSRGHEVEGIDYAAETVARARSLAPDLKVRVGDVYRLDAADAAYGGYLSVGVLEHNPDGPLDGIREARRVLREDGLAFIAVPYLNRKRARHLRRAPLAREALQPDGSRFYQFYFSIEDFREQLALGGLEVVEMLPYSLYSGLTRDFALGRFLHRNGFFVWRVHRAITRRCRTAPMWARRRWAHMLLFVCRPRS